MNLISILTWLAAGIELSAMWLLGRKIRGAFILLSANDLLWGAIALMTQPKLWGLLVVVSVLFIVNLRNYKKWKTPALPASR